MKKSFKLFFQNCFYNLKKYKMAIKKTKYPKKPKSSASLARWEKYRDKVKEVTKINSQKESDKKKKENIIKTVDKLKK